MTHYLPCTILSRINHKNRTVSKLAIITVAITITITVNYVPMKTIIIESPALAISRDAIVLTGSKTIQGKCELENLKKSLDKCIEEDDKWSYC